MHLVISGRRIKLPKFLNTEGDCTWSPFQSSTVRNSADWRIASNILPAQPSPLCFSCLWSHTVITSFLSDHQICCCYCFSQSVCCLKSCLLHSSWCSGVHLGLFNLLTGFQLLFFFINPVNDTKLFQDDWHQSGRVLVIGTPFANEVIFVSQQVERLWCICWEQFLAGYYEGRDRGPLQAHKAFAFGAWLLLKAWTFFCSSAVRLAKTTNHLPSPTKKILCAYQLVEILSGFPYL